MPLSFSNTVSSPAGNALSSKLGINSFPTSFPGSMANSTSSTLFAPKAPVVPAAPAPSTPVKSTTVSHPDGTSIATTYHAPASTGLVGNLVGATQNSPVSPANIGGQTTGTQHPGDPGFAPITPAVHPTATAEYNSDGTYAGTVPAGATANNATPGPTTFGGIIGGLTTAAQNGSGVANTAANGLLQAPNQNQILGDKAAQIGDSYGKQIAQVGGAGAQFESGQLTTGTSPVAQGNAAVTANTTANEQQALATGEQAALQGNAQQLTAQNQGQAGLTNAGSIGNTSQSNVQSGLTSAGSLAQPNTAAYGQTVFDPTTGTFKSGGSNLDPQTQAGTLAQQVQGGQLTYDQALASMGYAGAAGTTFLNNAITQAGGNPLQLQAQGTATQGVIGTQQAQVAGYQSALQQGQNLQSQLTDLIGTFGLNPNDVNAVNTGLQKIAQNTSSPQYKILSNYVNDIANTYSQVLTPAGGSQTDTTRSLAASMLDATAKGSSLVATMQALDQAAKAKIAGVSTTGTPAGAVTSGGSTNASSLNSSAAWPGF